MKTSTRLSIVFLFLTLRLELSAQNTYHILPGDTNYYHWVGDPQTIKAIQDSTIHNYLLDIAWPSWERKPGTPDGTYYIYYDYDKFNYSYQVTHPLKPGDTVCYEIKTYKNGQPEGYMPAYYYKEKSLIAEEYYSSGKLTSQVRYDRYCGSLPTPQRDPMGGHGVSVSVGFIIPHNVVRREHYDSLGRCTFSNALICNYWDSSLVYEERTSYNPLNISLVSYHYSKPHQVSAEINMLNDTLTIRRWCEDGELYYHRVEKTWPAPNDTWGTLEIKMMVNLLEGEDRQWDRWWNYCRY